MKRFPVVALVVFMTSLVSLAAVRPNSPVKSLRLPDAIRGDRYETLLGNPLSSRCHLPDVTWRVTSGTPPQGITAGLNGVVGTPAQAGDYEFVIEAANECQKVSVPVVLAVRNRPVLAVSRESLTFESRVGAGDELTASVLVGSDWPDRAVALSSSEPAWLDVTPRNAATPEAPSALSAIRVTVRVRPSGLKAGTYRAKIFVSMNRAETVALPVTLAVKEK